MKKFSKIVMAMVLSTAMVGMASAAVTVQGQSIITAPSILSTADTQVELSWDIIPDASGYEVYYDTKTVVDSTDPNATFANVDTVLGGTNNSLTVKGLVNDTEYFFSVVPTYDTNSTVIGNIFYSPEVKATPSAGVGNSNIFAINSAVALDKNRVELTFSHPVIIPTLTPEAHFTITDTAQTNLNITGAVVDTVDQTKVVLTTADQADITYNVVVGLKIVDDQNQPIRTGIADNVDFAGFTVVNASAKVVDTVITTPDTTTPTIDTVITTPDTTTPTIDTTSLKGAAVDLTTTSPAVTTTSIAVDTKAPASTTVKKSNKLPKTGFGTDLLLFITFTLSAIIYIRRRA